MPKRNGKFTDHKNRLVHVENEPLLAEFLDQLSGSGGELQEDLTCTIDGGIGGIEDNFTFPAGTPLEDVLIALLSGQPELSLTGFALHSDDATNSAPINTGQSNPYAAGTELTIGSIKFAISDDAGAIGSNTGTLSFGDDGTLDEGSIPILTGTNSYDSPADNTVGKTTSTLPLLLNNAFRTQTIKISVTTDSGQTLTGTKQIIHALPAFLINVNESSLSAAIVESTFALDPTLLPALFTSPNTIISTVTKVDAVADYREVWANTEADWTAYPAGTVRHYFMIPAVNPAQPGSTLTYTIGGTPGSGDFTTIGLANFNMSPTGFNLIDDPGATAVPYRLHYFNNLSSITATSTAIELT